MSAKVIMINGMPTQVLCRNFETGHEGWGDYILDNGTVIRVRTVVSEILEIPNAVNNYGEQAYLVMTTNVISQQPVEPPPVSFT